ncbi:hypothetical protein OWT79_10470 [Bacteroides fragilis]|nr:hypothetical protein [Bacteroides fragilis]
MKKLNVQHDLDSRREISQSVKTTVTDVKPFSIVNTDANSQAEKRCEDNQVPQQERKKTKTGRQT